MRRHADAPARRVKTIGLLRSVLTLTLSATRTARRHCSAESRVAQHWVTPLERMGHTKHDHDQYALRGSSFLVECAASCVHGRLEVHFLHETAERGAAASFSRAHPSLANTATVGLTASTILAPSPGHRSGCAGSRGTGRGPCGRRRSPPHTSSPSSS